MTYRLLDMQREAKDTSAFRAAITAVCRDHGFWIASGREDGLLILDAEDDDEVKFEAEFYRNETRKVELTDEQDAAYAEAVQLSGSHGPGVKALDDALRAQIAQEAPE